MDPRGVLVQPITNRPLRRSRFWTYGERVRDVCVCECDISSQATDGSTSKLSMASSPRAGGA